MRLVHDLHIYINLALKTNVAYSPLIINDNK